MYYSKLHYITELRLLLVLSSPNCTRHLVITYTIPFVHFSISLFLQYTTWSSLMLVVQIKCASPEISDILPHGKGGCTFVPKLLAAFHPESSKCSKYQPVWSCVVHFQLESVTSPLSKEAIIIPPHGGNLQRHLIAITFEPMSIV